MECKTPVLGTSMAVRRPAARPVDAPPGGAVPPAIPRPVPAEAVGRLRLALEAEARRLPRRLGAAVTE